MITPHIAPSEALQLVLQRGKFTQQGFTYDVDDHSLVFPIAYTPDFSHVFAASGDFEEPINDQTTWIEG